ncbi:unnamed protein product [marine sediment metagenome]|uniref:Uncharacterized protein n=1 Tax=marine sediment metagenome TaxID=412755 RepID=X1U4P9_9ZZZZ
MKVIDTLWFTNLKGTAGIVILEEDVTGDRKAYIGVVDGLNEQTDREALLAWGNKFSLSTAEQIVQKLTKPVVGSISS